MTERNAEKVAQLRSLGNATVQLSRNGATHGATDMQPVTVKDAALRVLERNRLRNCRATTAQLDHPEVSPKVASNEGVDDRVAQLRCLGDATMQLAASPTSAWWKFRVTPMTGAPFEWAFASGATMAKAQTVADELYPGSTIEPLEPYPDQPQPQPDAQPPADLTDHERGLLVQMGMRWGYTPEDWDRLWSACLDHEQRANWLRIAQDEAPGQEQPDDQEPSITVRMEGSFGSGRKQFDIRVPLDRWSEQKFSEQIAATPGAQFWRLDTPKTCASCRHAQPTQHVALVRCGAGREDYPACGAFWDSDPKPCRSWAPAANTSTQGHLVGQIQEKTR